ncbi:MAG: polynucleotide adenylyltransferase PcnB [Chromatiales bacterium]|nr:polynucleotide adenylyltransferase PcnB [Chromatiales bacterium]
MGPTAGGTRFKAGTTAIHSAPAVIPRSAHTISRSLISESALKVLYRLHKSGFQAHLVGGGVRDLLLGREPKDFDVATDARPEQVAELFRNARLIGRRFRLAHVRYGRDIVEVATFRKGSDPDEDHDGMTVDGDGRLLRDNVYGTIEEDAWRRDFTVNALYYNIDDFSVLDFVGGRADLDAGVIRLIGDPERRYREDPVRMLRAARFAAKLGFTLEKHTEELIWQLGGLLGDIPPARLFDEVLKLFMTGHALQSFEQIRHFRLFGQLFPATESALAQEVQHFPITFVARAMENTDVRIADGRPVTPAFLFATLLWEPVRLRAEREMTSEAVPAEVIDRAADAVLDGQAARVSIPRRFTSVIREIWRLQPRFEQRNGNRAKRFLTHPRFRAAYDFLLLRAESGEVEPALAEWWTDLAEGRAEPAPIEADGPKRRNRRRRRRRKPAAESGS